MEIQQYPIAIKLDEDISRHCATLAKTESLVKGKNGLLQMGHPDEKSRNGTLTTNKYVLCIIQTFPYFFNRI
jgi:hypothetical protein